MNLLVLAMVMAFLMAGCSWQGTSADRGGDLHNGSPADWNTGTGKPDSGNAKAGAPAAEQSPSK